MGKRKFAVGDVVSYDLSRSHGGGPETATVIGYTFPDVCVVASAEAHGMPIGESHCTATGATDPRGLDYRIRYQSLYGDRLLNEPWDPSHDP